METPSTSHGNSGAMRTQSFKLLLGFDMSMLSGNAFISTAFFSKESRSLPYAILRGRDGPQQCNKRRASFGFQYLSLCPKKAKFAPAQCPNPLVYL
jgi:hypothetical protein